MVFDASTFPVSIPHFRHRPALPRLRTPRCPRASRTTAGGGDGGGVVARAEEGWANHTEQRQRACLNAIKGY
ncbi:hypothetical protein B1218_38380 [Pseudomonas ogarae]|nr:hypothetical protein B1218_38380 [Pseudomonas ogarae]